MEAPISSEISVHFYRSRQCYVSRDSIPQNHCGEKHRSLAFSDFVTDPVLLNADSTVCNMVTQFQKLKFQPPLSDWIQRSILKHKLLSEGKNRCDTRRTLVGLARTGQQEG
jgi:hypothetical protein